MNAKLQCVLLLCVAALSGCYFDVGALVRPCEVDADCSGDQICNEAKRCTPEWKGGDGPIPDLPLDSGEQDPDLGIDWKPALIGLAVTGGVCLLSFVGVTDVPETDPLNSTTNGIAGVAEWFPTALIAYGASYLALLLVCWRIWLWLRPRTAFTWAHLPVLILQLAPCPPMIFGLWEKHDEVWLVWILPGYVGMVTGPLFLIALIEVMVRILRRKKAARAQQSPPSP